MIHSKFFPDLGVINNNKKKNKNKLVLSHHVPTSTSDWMGKVKAFFFSLAQARSGNVIPATCGCSAVQRPLVL